MSISKGQILEGTVTGITKFGAFIELGTGETGLVHISEVADTYVKDVNEFLKEKDVVKVKVINVDDSGKIGLSIRQAKERPKQPTVSFEDRLARFMKDSDEKLASLNKNMIRNARAAIDIKNQAVWVGCVMDPYCFFMWVGLVKIP